MNSLDATNTMIFKHFFDQNEMPVATNLTSENILALSTAITPLSFKASFAHRFRVILPQATYQRLMIEETKRLYQRFLKGWLRDIAFSFIQMRQTSSSGMGIGALSPIQRDPLVLMRELESTFKEVRQMEVRSKKAAFSTVKPATHLISYQKDSEGKDLGVFKSLSGTQLAGELASYLIGLYCGIDVFHTVAPGYVWISDGEQKQRTTGIFSHFHEGTHTAFELSCSKSEGFYALNNIPAVCVQAISLMHMLRGSEDAHLGNTLVRLAKDPESGKSIVTRIYEIDGEQIMSASERNSDRSAPGKEIASLRIWWLGLPQAALPLERELLHLIISWSREKLYELHAAMGLYSKERVDAQIWRLTKMRTMATDALLHEKPITARDLFLELIHRHPTFGLLAEVGADDIWTYNQLGRISSDEIISKPL